jgi:Ca-activated chloride channel homolog
MSETQSGAGHEDVRVTLEARPERKLIPHGPSVRHMDYQIHVSAQSAKARETRAPLTLALVIDRSGSMSGEKIITAKRAALAALDQLDARDTASVVVFDEEITTVQPAAQVSPSLKRSVTDALKAINARGSTALHEGWLTGCNSIVNSDTARSGLARLFLLTDGLANVGLADPEQIATQAAGIRRNTGISTSTFGIGEDYAEELLGPMAEAGGGQFHNLRESAEIAKAFAGELGELLLTAAANVRLEIEAEPGATVELVSAYRGEATAERPHTIVAPIGDLIGGEERHVLARFSFPVSARREEQAVRARVLWSVDGVEKSTDWQELRFTYATDAECDAETPDTEIVHQLGEGISDRAQREALRRSKRGDFEGARLLLSEVHAQLGEYERYDLTLRREVEEVEQLDANLAQGPLPSAMSKETYFQRQARSRGQRDLRQ